MDPEVKARAQVAAVLDPLDRSAVASVLRWAAERYGLAPAVPVTARSAGASVGGALSEDEGSLY